MMALLHITEAMATKEDFEYLKNQMANRKHIESIKDDLDIIGDDMDTLNGELKNLHFEMSTKEDVRAIVDKVKEGLLEEIRPIARAVDKDAEYIVQYDKRIERLERHLALK